MSKIPSKLLEKFMSCLFMVAVFSVDVDSLWFVDCIVPVCCLLIVDGDFVFTIVVPDARIVFVLVAPLLLLLPSIFR